MNKTKHEEHVKLIKQIKIYLEKYPKKSNTDVGDKFKVNRAKIWRIRRDLNRPIFNKNEGTPNKTSSTINGFDGIIETTVNEKTGDKKTQIAHAGGPIKGTRNKINYSVMGYGDEYGNEYDDELVNNWTPNMQLSPVNSSTGIPLSASQVKTRLRKNPKTYFQYSVNPLQSLDYRAIQAMLRSTIGNSLFLALVKFIVGKGFKPELELINPDEDSKKNQEEIDANQNIIHDLLSIDRQLSYDDSGELDVSFIDKISGLILNALTYNRGALIFGYEKPVEVNGKKWAEIPSSIKSAHPADMGIIKENPETGRLQAFQWRNAFEMVPTSDSIYLFNPVLAANTHNANNYGDSMAISMIDALRVIRKNNGVNFGAMAEVAYAGLGLLIVRPQGSTAAQKQAEYNIVSKNIVPASINALIENPEDVDYHAVDYKPQVDQFVKMNESLIKYCVACIQLPHALFYDEASANRATLIGKIQLTIATVINPMREWIGRSISDQWYDRWFRLMYANTDIVKKFKIKLVFDDLHIEEWFDKIEATLLVDSRKQLTDKAFGEKSGIDNYTGDVESDAETMPGGSSSKSMKFGADQDGKGGFEIKDNSKGSIK